jgi:hypothetical protein
LVRFLLNRSLGLEVKSLSQPPHCWVEDSGGGGGGGGGRRKEEEEEGLVKPKQ